jgi:flagellar biogenesis protein FliO
VIPFKPADDLFATLGPLVLVLLVLTLAAAALLWYLRRNGVTLAVPGKARRLRVIERVALSRNAALVLVECDGRTLLVGQSGDRVSLIERAAPPASDAA